MERDIYPTFRSVILAGVYDVKNLRGKIRPEDEHRYNSPWNIAADFDISMSFSKNEIAGMLTEYEADYKTGMNVDEMAGLLFDDTSGYPFLVSRLCQLMDEVVCKKETYGSKSAAWTKEGFYEAQRLILAEKNMLFESLSEKLVSYPELNDMLKSLLFTGKPIVFNYYEPSIGVASMFGFVKNKNGMLVVANRIFETWLYNFLSVCGRYAEKRKLELTWVGKYDEEKPVEPRILLEDTEKSYGDPDSENMLIHGDNLIALQALQQDFVGKIKCIYIDPPYNTGSAFEYYDDDVEHSIWLSLMRKRLLLLHSLLEDDGFLCCHIDDSESHYLKVVLDEIFGRSNYLTSLYIRVRYPDKTLKSDMDFHKEIEQVLVYRKSSEATPNFDYDEVGYDKFIYAIEELGTGKEITLGGKKVTVFEKNEYKIIKKPDGDEYGLKEIWATGTILDGNSSGRFFRDYLNVVMKKMAMGFFIKSMELAMTDMTIVTLQGPKGKGQRRENIIKVCR